jgi:hypothetical protein
MATANDLRASAERFSALARKANNPATKLQLVSLAADYYRQANELRHEHLFCSPSSQNKMQRLSGLGHLQYVEWNARSVRTPNLTIVGAGN